MVMQQLTRPAEKTDDNPATRLQALQAERARIDRAIQDVQRFEMKPLDSKRGREIITLTEELVGGLQGRVRRARRAAPPAATRSRGK
jgi:hypothetical protein